VLDANPLRLIRRHRDVSRYRRQHASTDALKSLQGAPEKWL
jgi:hypothetical protein